MPRIIFHNVLNSDINIACSGGIDSIAISHFLRGKKHDLTLFHFNHHLRKENDEMQKSVERFANDFNLKIIVCHSDGNYDKSLGKEAAYRQKRLAAMKHHLHGQVVLAHHLDDCVESYLMNCFNGVGNYLPIPIKTKLNDNLTIVRPFLATLKSSFYKYCERNDLLKYVVEDKTNEDNCYRRNWIRNKVIPLVEEQYPGLSKVVKKRVLLSYRDVQKRK